MHPFFYIEHFVLFIYIFLKLNKPKITVRKKWCPKFAEIVSYAFSTTFNIATFWTDMFLSKIYIIQIVILIGNIKFFFLTTQISIWYNTINESTTQILINVNLHHNFFPKSSPRKVTFNFSKRFRRTSFLLFF